MYHFSLFLKINAVLLIVDYAVLEYWLYFVLEWTLVDMFHMVLIKTKKKNTYFGKTVKIMVKCLDANFDSWNLREFYRHFEDGAIIGPRSAFTLVFWRGKYLKKKKKKEQELLYRRNWCALWKENFWILVLQQEL